MRARPRRPVDEEVSAVSMNGVLIAAVCFLMATMSGQRLGLLAASVRVTRVDEAPAPPPLELHVRLHRWTCAMWWREDGRVVRRAEAPCVPFVERFPGTRIVRVRYAGLAEALAIEADASPRWARAEPAGRDELIFHVDDDVTYAYIAGAIDAASGVRRAEMERGEIIRGWAFRVSLATD